MPRYNDYIGIEEQSIHFSIVKKEQEIANYSPWGKQGAGAPSGSEGGGIRSRKMVSCLAQILFNPFINFNYFRWSCKVQIFLEGLGHLLNRHSCSNKLYLPLQLVAKSFCRVMEDTRQMIFLEDREILFWKH